MDHGRGRVHLPATYAQASRRWRVAAPGFRYRCARNGCEAAHTVTVASGGAPGPSVAKRRVSPDAAVRPPGLTSEHVSAGCVRRPGAARGYCRPRGPGGGPVTGPGPQWHVAECLLPGLSRATAEALGRRVRQEIAGPAGSQVSYLGSLLMPEDEVLLCLFAGPEAEVRAVSERAGLPFERILACVGVGWRTETGGGRP